MPTEMNFHELNIGDKFQFNGAVYEKKSNKRAIKLEGINPGKYRNFSNMEKCWKLN